MNRPIITLTTDFGVIDSFVASLHAVIRSISPDAEIIDITHNVPAYDVHAGAFIFEASRTFFPSGTIHLLIVDPGVGTDRRPLLVVSPDAFFVCPDNGLLSYSFAKAGSRLKEGLQTIALPKGWEAYNLNNESYWLHPVSTTFHGRDLFAPVAAHLSNGVEPNLLGTRLDSVVTLNLSMPVPIHGGIRGEVIHVDKFGNLITNIDGHDWSISDIHAVVIIIGKYRIHGLSSSYQQSAPNLMAILGSSGYIEISVPNGNASKDTHCGVGSVVYLKMMS
jgi:S-adenosylmethionine hydrolase